MFRPQSCERFAVTIPDCGMAPDGIKLMCGNIRGIGGGSGWQIDHVLLGRAGNDSGQRFAYSGVEKLLKVMMRAVAHVYLLMLVPICESECGLNCLGFMVRKEGGGICMSTVPD